VNPLDTNRLRVPAQDAMVLCVRFQGHPGEPPGAGRRTGGRRGFLVDKQGVLQRFIFHMLGRLAADTACRLGGTLGVLAWRLGVRRRVVNAQLTSCMGLRGVARAQVARRSYATIGANFLQVWAIGGPDGPERHITVLNPTWIRRVNTLHPSAVFLTAHLGDWDMSALSLTQFLDEVLIYAKAQHNVVMDKLLNQRRSATGLRVVLVQPKDRTGAVLALKALRRGAALGMMADQRPSGGTPAWFLNRPAWCFDGPSFFARKAGVPIIPGCTLHRRAGVSVLFIGRPFFSSADHAADVQRCMDEVTRMIVAHPGQYFWQHRRFAGPQPELPPR
jgi:lauroyl/myristoyl acyltransferase